jgi:hypothetical protein
MGTHFTIRHTFDVDVDTFWNEVFFDADFNRKLYLEALGFKTYDVVEEKKDPDGTVHRKVRQTPRSDAPAVVKKLVGDEISYVEEGRFDPTKKRWSYTITPSKLPDKIKIGGEFWVEPKGEGKIERLCTVDLSVKIFGVGGAVESFIEKQTKDSYDKAALFTRKFIEERGLSKKS